MSDFGVLKILKVFSYWIQNLWVPAPPSYFPIEIVASLYGSYHFRPTISLADSLLSGHLQLRGNSSKILLHFHIFTHDLVGLP